MPFVYRIQLEASPKQATKHSAEFGGAYVNCWVLGETDEDAVQRTVAAQAVEGWEIVGFPEVSILTDRDAATDREEVKNYDLAMKRGGVFEYIGWPPDGGASSGSGGA